MVDFEPLAYAIFASKDEKEVELLDAIYDALEDGFLWPRRYYNSGKFGDVLSENSLTAMGKVLRSIDAEEEEKKKKRVLEETIPTRSERAKKQRSSVNPRYVDVEDEGENELPATAPNEGKNEGDAAPIEGKIDLVAALNEGEIDLGAADPKEGKIDPPLFE